MEPNETHRFTRRDIYLFVLGIAGFAIFAAMYGRLSPVSAVRMKINEKQATHIAQAFFEQQGIDLEEYRKEAKLVSDGEQMMYLQKTLGLSEAQAVMRERIPVYYWELLWRRKGGFEFSVNQHEEDVKIPEDVIALKAKIDGKGTLFSYDFSIANEDTGGGLVLDREQALALVRDYLSRDTGLDLSGYQPSEEIQVSHKGATDWDFQWEKENIGIADERIEIGVAVQGNRIVTYDFAYRAPEGTGAVYERETDMSTPFVVFLILSWVLVGILFLVLFFIKAIRSELEYKFGLRLGIILGVLNLVAALAALYDRQWDLFLGAAIGAFFVCFGGSLIWAVCDSLARSTWKDKLAVVDALIRKRFLTIEFGRATMRGYALAFVCLGLVTILTALGRGSSVLWLTDEGALNLHRASFSFVHLIVDALIMALFLEIFFRLFLVSYLRSKIRSLPLVTILAGAVLGFSGIQIFKLAPTWGAVLSMCIIAWVFSYAFVRYELTTVATGSFVMIGLWKAWPFLSMGDVVHVGNGLVALALLAVPFVLGYISLKGKESVEQMEEYIPPYMARAIEQERMKQELEIARRVQRSFLPRRNPLIEKVDIAAVCVPANEVGGDYYDFIPMGPHRIGLVIGDVSGKGVSAAFYMALMKGFLRAEAANLDSPKSILSKVNARFYENSDPNVFISMVYGVLDSRQRTLTYARAGHNPVILHRTAEGTSQSFSPPGLALGLDNGQIFDRVIAEEIIPLNDGDVLVFYTDGFTEASNWRKEEFGEERLLALIEMNREKNAAGIISSIEEEIRSFIGETAQWDDMTMVVAKIL